MTSGGAGAGGDRIYIDVVNPPGVAQTATGTAQRGPDGRMMIKLILTEVAKDIRNNGITSKAISDTYKSNPGPAVNRG
jgi:hypothetical protein